MFFNKKKSVLCPPKVLFDIIKEDLRLKICCDIQFIWQNQKHKIGVWGDNGETVENLHFYFDKQEFSSLEALIEHACLNSTPLIRFQEKVLITECDACYPDSTALLRQYL